MNDIMHELVLGIDGGGSKTEAILAQAVKTKSGAHEWKTLGTGLAKGCNVARQIKVEPIAAAIDAAFQEAGLPNQTVAAACFALAGCGAAPVAEAASKQISAAQFAHAFRVVPDAEPLLAHVPANTPAIALICGTGSLAWGRSHDKTVRAGGWGPHLGDEGSGYWIAMAALRAVTRAADGFLTPTALTKIALDALQVDTVREIPPRVAQADRRALARIAPHVLAAEGDAIAESIIAQAINELAQLILRVAAQLEPIAPIELAFAGGLLVNHPVFAAKLESRLANEGLAIENVSLIERPVGGAVTMACAQLA